MRTVVAAVDFSDVSPDVVAAAVGLASGADATVWLVHVAAPDPDFAGYSTGPQEVRDAVADALRADHRELEALARSAAVPGVRVEPLMVRGPTVDTLVAKAADLAADVIVVGSHGRGALLRAVLGSVSEGVVRRAGRPVLIVPSRAEETGG